MQVGGKPGELRQVEMGRRQLGSEGPRGADELSDACPDRAQGEQVLGLVRPIAGVVELVIDDVEAFGDRGRPDALVLDPPGHLGLDGEALVQPERAEALVGVDLEDARLVPGSGGVRVPDDRPVALGEHQVPAGG